MDKVVVERRSIDVVPDSERHGTPISQFTPELHSALDQAGYTLTSPPT